jgi:hypothetical protein
MTERSLPRRRVLAGLAALPLGAALARLAPARAETRTLAATPACDDHPTPEQTEGPYWTPNSPERSEADGIYRRELEMTVSDSGDASFTFVVEK